MCLWKPEGNGGISCLLKVLGVKPGSPGQTVTPLPAEPFTNPQERF